LSGGLFIITPEAVFYRYLYYRPGAGKLLYILGWIYIWDKSDNNCRKIAEFSGNTSTRTNVLITGNST